MNKYGEIAVHAAHNIEFFDGDPRASWEASAVMYYPMKPHARNKVCPKSTFLGLCSFGFVKGIESGEYIRDVENKVYAGKAIGLLKRNPELSVEELWDAIAPDKTHNMQMHVVKGLFDKGFIKK